MIQTAFRYNGAFNGDYAIVANDQHWGIITKDGKTLVAPQYDITEELNAYQFNDGLLPASKDGLFGYINEAGKLLIPHHTQRSLPAM